MVQIVSQPDRGTVLVRAGGVATTPLDNFFDELVQLLNDMVLGDAVQLPLYTVSTVPDAALWRGAMIYVTDEAGGEVSATSDGTNWRRSTDRAIIS